MGSRAFAWIPSAFAWIPAAFAWTPAAIRMTVPSEWNIAAFEFIHRTAAVISFRDYLRCLVRASVFLASSHSSNRVSSLSLFEVDALVRTIQAQPPGAKIIPVMPVQAL